VELSIAIPRHIVVYFIACCCELNRNLPGL